MEQRLTQQQQPRRRLGVNSGDCLVQSTIPFPAEADNERPIRQHVDLYSGYAVVN